MLLGNLPTGWQHGLCIGIADRTARGADLGAGATAGGRIDEALQLRRSPGRRRPNRGERGRHLGLGRVRPAAPADRTCGNHRLPRRLDPGHEVIDRRVAASITDIFVKRREIGGDLIACVDAARTIAADLVGNTPQARTVHAIAPGARQSRPARRR